MPHNHSRSLDSGVCPDKLAVFSGDGKTPESVASGVSAHQPPTDMIEGDPNTIAFDLVALVWRSGEGQVLLIGDRSSGQTQPMPHCLFVGRVDIKSFPDNPGDDLGGLGTRQGSRLRFAQDRPDTFDRVAGRWQETGQLNPEKWQILDPPASTPIPNHVDKELAVGQGIVHGVGVGFALVPEDPFDGEPLQGIHHVVVKQGRELSLVILEIDREVADSEFPRSHQ